MRKATYQVAKDIFFFAVQAADHFTPITGATWSLKVSKAGAASVTPSGTASQLDSANHPGWYKITFAAGDFSVLGEMVVTATATGADPVNFIVLVESRPELIVGKVNDASPTSTSFVTDLAQTQTDFPVGSRVVFLTGNRKGESKPIQGYDGATKKIFLAQSFVAAPANGDFFVLANGA